MSTEPAPGGNPVTGDVFNITAAQRALSNEQTGRTRRYLVSMGIRTACVIAAIFVPGWPRWVLIAAAVALPYLAVVIANGGRESDKIGELGVGQIALPQIEPSSANLIVGAVQAPPTAEHR
ncbi:MAG: DUF3099 domain-containing protein [Actinomycetota bacterium]|nr:DUF3099 domain-containing protein [Actinomycetota bacterium]MDP2288660.1 DUF3099 domain-containing protein [Actinomycetota bacterium]